MHTIAVKEKQFGSVLQARKKITKEKGTDVLSLLRELQEAPDMRAITSVFGDDVFKGIEPMFPVLLKRESNHRMTLADFLNELDMILGMGDVRDPNAGVYVYSIQVTEPQDYPKRVDRPLLEGIVPSDSLIELGNGYIHHSILYELTDPHRHFILSSVLPHATELHLSLKPPWSQYRVESVVALE